MGKGMGSKLATHLLLCDLRSSHCDESTPGTFGKAIGGLSTRICSNDFGIIAVNPLVGLTTNELSIEIGVGLLRDAIHIGAK